MIFIKSNNTKTDYLDQDYKRSNIPSYKYFTISFVLIITLFLSPYVKGQITRSQILNNASPYTSFTWTANSCNINDWVGVSCGGKIVYRAPWVKIGSNVSMPYMWGGWSTISQHNNAMTNCKSAGDACSINGGSCSGNGSGLSCASGHDCSGLVSRAWALSTKYGTINLGTVGTAIPASQLQPGDIVNKSGDHTRLITENYGNGNYQVIEASGVDWKTSYRTYSPMNLSGYTPLCYNNVQGGCSGQPDLTITAGTQSVSPSTVTAGSNITASCSENNSGTGSAGSNHVTLWLSSDNVLNTSNDLYLGQIQFPALASNSNSLILSTSVQIPSTICTGNYYLFFWADGNQLVNEGSNENNNFASKIITVNSVSLSAPSANAASNIAETSFQANWNAVTGASGYKLDLSLSSSFNSFIAGYENLNVNNTSLNITGLLCNTTYYYRVRAYNNCGVTSDNSSAITAATSTCSSGCPSLTAPNNLQPGSLTAPGPVLTSNPTFTWTKTGAAFYRFELRKEPYGTNDIIAGSCSSETPPYTITTPGVLQNGVNYRWSVSAIPACSSPCAATSTYYYFTYNSVTCAAPTIQASIITITPSVNQVTLNMSAGNGSRRLVKINNVNNFSDPQNGSDPTANSVYSNAGEQVVYNGSSTDAIISGLNPGGNYCFRIYEANCTGSQSMYNVTGTSTICQVTNIPTSVQTIAGLEEFKIIPNPNAGIFNVIMKLNTIKDVRFILVNAEGQIVYQSVKYRLIGSQTKEIIGNKLAPGIYLLKTIIGNETMTEKIIVSR